MLIPLTPKAARRLRDFAALVVCCFCFGPGWAVGQAPAGAPEAQAGFAAAAKRAFLEAQKRYQGEPQNHEVAWQFARACFDLAELATNGDQRAEIAAKGMGIAQELVAQVPDSAPAHYYLGMNLGQLARTRSLGALKLLNQMEREFGRARELNEKLDYAGPDRNLGLLYLEAPAMISLGDRTKARQHLKRAVELAPEYPANRLNLVEAFVKWSEWDEARRQLKQLEDQWPAAHKAFAGDGWASSWMDWDQRLGKARKLINEAPKPLDQSHRKKWARLGPAHGTQPQPGRTKKVFRRTHSKPRIGGLGDA